MSLNFHGALMRDITCQSDRLKIERSSFADKKGAYVHLPKMVSTQQNPALMRDKPNKAEQPKIEGSYFGDNKSAHVHLPIIGASPTSTVR